MRFITKFAIALAGSNLLPPGDAPAQPAPTENLYIRVVDVGPGLCVVGLIPGGHSFVYDTGPPRSICSAAVDDLIALVGAVDGICQMQAKADADFFITTMRRPMAPAEIAAIQAVVLKAYRWQYIGSGAQGQRFSTLLGSMITPAQGERIGAALAPLM